MGDTVTLVAYQQWRALLAPLHRVPARYTTTGAVFISSAAHQPQPGIRA
jgi:hypothetical protein